jgi:hypothetical protein
VSTTESLPRQVRAGGFGLIYAASISLFGGTAQPLTAWLTGITGNPLVPAWYMLGILLLGLFALAHLRETAPVMA